jgi:TRAP-type C4-dicarboxylate transport system permease small subunit
MRLIEKILDFITLAGFIGMLLATGIQVLFRYVLEIPLAWTEELARVLFTTTMFLGMAIALREDEHIVVDFLFKRLPARASALGNAIIYFMILLFLIILARGTWIMIGITWESYMIAMDWMRTAYLYLAELAAIVLMAYYAFKKIVQNLRIMASGVEETTKAADPAETG